jgi:hyaluronate lyase
MTYAYATEGTSLYQNPLLKNDIISALDWMNIDWYSAAEPYSAHSATNNWYQWEIGSPLHLTDIMALLYNDLTSAQIANYCDAMDHFNPDPGLFMTSVGNSTAATGANLAWKV